jgi:hypothetical protein
MAYRSISTVKADQARERLGADGNGIVWAVISSGIDGMHPHFRMHSNLELTPPLIHRNFTATGTEEGALVDEFGVGTHVASIIAGEFSDGDVPLIAQSRSERSDAGWSYVSTRLKHISGMAPKCKLVSLKVLDTDGLGPVSAVIQALAAVEEMNDNGREIRIHGVDLGVGYEWDANLYACGQSPLCVAVDRVVRSGVVVVVPSGNTGYGTQHALERTTRQGLVVSINDPGNSELAITVGSTHRDRPQVYGISYFSGKGPTLDGRRKPDVVAPGEYVISALAKTAITRLSSDSKTELRDNEEVLYREDSGTSTAAAHVSGVIAAYLSVRREFIGKPDTVKMTFTSTTTDLKRTQEFQGTGLVDLMRALQPGVVSAPTPQLQEDKPIKLFISYAHEDEGLKKVLLSQLASLNRQGLIEIWEDRRLRPSAHFDDEIKSQLERADVIVLLVSADFMASEYCFSTELKRAVQKDASGTARVIPVIVRPVDWEGAPFAHLTALPTDAVPVTTWKNIDQAWLDVALGIRRIVEDLRQHRGSLPQTE